MLRYSTLGLLLVGFAAFACNDTDDAEHPATSDPITAPSDAGASSSSSSSSGSSSNSGQSSSSSSSGASEPGPTSDASTDSPDAAARTAPDGTWVLAAATDRTVAGFTSLTFASGGTYTETGRTDEGSGQGTWSQPASIDIASDFGDPPDGLHGPYVELIDGSDGRWIYAWSEAVDGSTLSLTLYAETRGMGLRWADPVTLELVRQAPAPVGTWVTDSAADTTAAGFSTLTIGEGGTWTEVGGAAAEQGTYTLPPGIDIASDFGDPPAGMHGPYVALVDEGDGQWDYGYAVAGSSLTLTLFADRRGMGLRWVDPAVTVHLHAAP